MKVAALRSVVCTIPTKSRGLRIQSSDIILGEPGLGKGAAFQWRDDLLVDVKKMLLQYADEELRKANLPDIEPLEEGVKRGCDRKRFKCLDGIQRLADMDLPFLVDLPNGSCEGVF